MKNRDIDTVLDEWLEAGPTIAPHRVADAARLEVRATRQSIAARWWPSPRYLDMSNGPKLALGVVAVVAIAILGVSFLAPGGPRLGGAPDPTPTVTPSPLPLPDTTGQLPAGTYFVDDPALTPARFTIEVPPGWETIAGTFIGKIADQRFYVAVSPWVVDNVYADPCQWVGTELDPPVGPTVDDLASALAEQVGRNASGPVDVTLGGYPGKKIELSVPDDFDITACDNGDFRMWRSLGSAGGYNYGPGQRDTVYILDVDGERLVIHAMSLPTASDEDVAELEAVVDSIRITP